ncbi:o-succinylbenzoate synthase [Sphaerothrix gracilis]|uniref:o-succinylbenzoate synthase n=1 Tax=Sphaerothrix gracilis TaxID=3151835 RepID=UPI0031FBD870
MLYRCEFRPYRRPFRQPLQTRHGAWTLREGIILRLWDEAGQVSYGEIATLPWFGTETLAEALDLCRQQSAVTAAAIAQIPHTLPACQFGFGAAAAQLGQKPRAEFTAQTICGLLPTGAEAQTAWQPLWQSGHRTFKWKIGVAEIADELSELEKLAEKLPPAAKLRLDANGGLTFEQAQTWLQTCDRLQIEFLEQPLPPDRLQEMRQLSDRYQTPIALDESVATLKDLKYCYDQGWPGLFVVKAAIAGLPEPLYQFCQSCRDRLIFSSVFETPVARQAVLALVTQLYPEASSLPYALGFGTQQWFADSFDSDFEQLWQSL